MSKPDFYNHRYQTILKTYFDDNRPFVTEHVALGQSTGVRLLHLVKEKSLIDGVKSVAAISASRNRLIAAYQKGTRVA
jgi:hypothetical protein